MQSRVFGLSLSRYVYRLSQGFQDIHLVMFAGGSLQVNGAGERCTASLRYFGRLFLRQPTAVHRNL